MGRVKAHFHDEIEEAARTENLFVRDWDYEAWLDRQDLKAHYDATAAEEHYHRCESDEQFECYMESLDDGDQ